MKGLKTLGNVSKKKVYSFMDMRKNPDADISHVHCSNFISAIKPFKRYFMYYLIRVTSQTIAQP